MGSVRLIFFEGDIPEQSGEDWQPSIEVLPGVDGVTVRLARESQQRLFNRPDYDSIDVLRNVVDNSLGAARITPEFGYRRGFSFVDTSVLAGLLYYYWIRVRYTTGVTVISQSLRAAPITIDLESDPAAHEIDIETETEIGLLNNAVLPDADHRDFATGSLLGAFSFGVYFSGPLSADGPDVVEENPNVGGLAPVGSRNIFYRLTSLPKPGGAGIDDAVTEIYIATSSQFSGAQRLIWKNGLPQDPAWFVSIIPYLTDTKDRWVFIRAPINWFAPGDTVAVRNRIADLDGNDLDDEYTFAVDDIADYAPDITLVGPQCASVDNSPVSNIEIVFTDTGWGVDFGSVVVTVTDGSSAPVTIYNGGVVGGWTAEITDNGDGTFTLTLNHPLDQPWSGPTVCVNIYGCSNENPDHLPYCIDDDYDDYLNGEDLEGCLDDDFSNESGIVDPSHDCLLDDYSDFVYPCLDDQFAEFPDLTGYTCTVDDFDEFNSACLDDAFFSI